MHKYSGVDVISLDNQQIKPSNGTTNILLIKILICFIFQTVVYNLISWESIRNTPEWIEKQIPLTGMNADQVFNAIENLTTKTSSISSNRSPK